jgi:raffinose/stachyose/melibiose transport system permease protein
MNIVNKSIAPSKKTALLYSLPGFIIYTAIVLVPILIAIYYGTFNWAGGLKKTFIGFDNYVNVFKDKVFLQSLGNNLFLTVFCMIGQIGLALLFTIWLNGRHARFKGLHRTMMYFPSVLSAVVVGFVWSMIYDYNYGLLNNLLISIGQGKYAQAWLNNDKIALLMVAIPLVWQYVGYYLIILISAFSAIDPSIFEMAEIDGASGWRKAVYITMPMIKNSLIVCVTLCISGNMKIFDHIYVMTAGGPGTVTSVMAMYAYKTSFLQYKMGYASAMSVIILIISLVLVGGSRMLLMRREKGEA